MSPAARLRRAYFDCRYGQLHVHQAIPPGGGFDEATPLLCLPGRQGSGRFFQPLLAVLGADRSIYAPDLPGCGESDGAGPAAGAEQYALAVIDLLDSLRQRQIDLLAHAEGAATALAVETLRPQTLVRRLVLSAAPPTAVERVRALKIAFRELAQPGLVADSPSLTLETAQVTELIDFFGSVRPA